MSDGELAASRGAVRDGAAGVESFAHLLGSRRVGPRGVALALPEVHEACAELVVALDRYIEAIGAAFKEAADPEAAQAAAQALSHANAEVARLEGELSSAKDAGVAKRAPSEEGAVKRAGAPSVKQGIDARLRLALEASVRRTARELDASLHLADLVIATLEPRPTALDLIDMLRERSAKIMDRQRVVDITIAAADRRVTELEGDVRVVSGLIEIVLGMVRSAGVLRPHVRASRHPDGRLQLAVGERGAAERGDALILSVLLRGGTGERAAAVARAVARRVQIDLAVEGDGRAATMQIGRRR